MDGDPKSVKIQRTAHRVPRITVQVSVELLWWPDGNDTYVGSLDPTGRVDLADEVVARLEGVGCIVGMDLLDVRMVNVQAEVKP